MLGDERQVEGWTPAAVLVHGRRWRRQVGGGHQRQLARLSTVHGRGWRGLTAYIVHDRCCGRAAAADDHQCQLERSPKLLVRGGWSFDGVLVVCEECFARGVGGRGQRHLAKPATVPGCRGCCLASVLVGNSNR
uniref:Uncharacterized protein n=1 Tax=Arundo donax TaxID=35708 RepID=A0A0A8Y7E3_ARUDO